MGGCCNASSQENPNPVLEEEEEDDGKKYKKLLLLGAGWSGKSTVFKQMKVLYGNGFSDEERESLRWNIYQNISQAMKTLCEENKDGKYGENDPNLAEAYEAVRTYDDKGDHAFLDKTLGAHIKALWNDPAIKQTYEHRTEFFFANDEVHFFLIELTM